MTPAWRDSLRMGAQCAGVGLAVGLLVAAGGYGSNNPSYHWFAAYSTPAAFITGSGLWWLLMGRPGKSGAWRGAFVGALSGALAHYVCWYLNILVANVELWVGGGTRGPQGLMDPLQALLGAGILSFWSLLLYGIITVPAGALIGAWLGRTRLEIGSPPTRG